MLARAREAVALLARGVDALLEMGEATDFAALGPDGLIETMRAVEAQRNRLAGVDHAFVEAAEAEQLWERTTARGTAGALAQILHLTIGEASARVQAARWFGPRVSLDGQELPPVLPATAAAVRDGTVSAAQSSVIGHCLDELGCAPQVSADDLQRAELTLIEHAAAFGPRQLQRVACHIVDVLVPDGTPPREALVAARRGVVIGAQRRDGTATISGVLTPQVRAQLWAVLNPLSAPQAADGAHRDPRSAAQRTHDALGDACAMLLRSGELPRTGGVPATVIITATLDAVVRAGEHVLGGGIGDASGASFTTADGMRLSLAQVLEIAGQAQVVPAFLNAVGGIVAYGARRRCASPGQIKALIARDGGCSFPDCDAPPQWCEAHHVVPWIAGGSTDLSNLTLLCGYHHRVFEQRAWRCTMIDGTPHWIPPSWVDPARRPLRNRRLAELDPRQCAPDRPPPPAPDPPPAAVPDPPPPESDRPRASGCRMSVTDGARAVA